jgi:DNA-binding response OmpR family regulator
MDGSVERPRLEVFDPGGRHFATLTLDGTEHPIGRAPAGDGSDGAALALPDPEVVISRFHCSITIERGLWWVVDNASRNGTYVRRGALMARVEGRSRLAHGDAVCISAAPSGDGAGKHWELRFVDSNPTREGTLVGAVASPSCVRYDADEGKLYVRTVDGFSPVTLRPNEHRLVRYMAGRNGERGGVPVLCTYDELVDAVWGATTPRHRRDEVAAIVHHLRQTVAALGGDEPIENERSLGYRLLTCG